MELFRLHAYSVVPQRTTDETILSTGGAIKPMVDRIFEFSDAVAAFDYLIAGHARGKVVLDLDTGLADQQ